MFLTVFVYKYAHLALQYQHYMSQISNFCIIS